MTAFETLVKQDQKLKVRRCLRCEYVQQFVIEMGPNEFKHWTEYDFSDL
jgi:hypothetical protein